jgi:hypothetical protein
MKKKADIDARQQEQIDRLIEIDRKHDAQFFIVGAIEAFILVWLGIIMVHLWH